MIPVCKSVQSDVFVLYWLNLSLPYFGIHVPKFVGIVVVDGEIAEETLSLLVMP